jgi:ATP-binding cassette, subfamily B, bacterial
VVFYLVLRPLAFAVSSASNSIIIGPNVLPLVLSRLHRWTLGQAVTFFDNDFAGRIAQKQMQAARAVTDVATEVINTVCFALASVIGSVIFLLVVDMTIAAALAVWLVAYIFLIRFLHATGAPELRRPRVQPRDGLGTGRRHHHQHQDGQAFRPRRLRRPRGP